MARLVFPSSGERLVYRVNSGTVTAALATSVTVYSDSAATVLADLQTYPDGLVIAGSVVVTDSFGQLPLFYGPADGTDTLYVRITGGPITALYAREDDRLDALSSGKLDVTAASATYEAVIPVPVATGVLATDWANISAALTRATAALAAGGKTVAVVFPACPVVSGLAVPYEIGANSITVTAGVHLIGQPPKLVEVLVAAGTYLPDGEWNYAGGTVLHGDGTAPALAANNVAGGTPGASWGDGQIAGVRLYGFGLDNFTYGAQVGAANVMGLVFSEVDELYAKNCSQWAFWFANFQHVNFGNLRSCLSQNGHYYAALVAGATLAPGNSAFRELFNLVPRDGRDSRLCRGIVFEAAGTSAILNECLVIRAQNNRFGTTLLSVTAGFTNTSTTVTVPDGTKFTVGMPVTFTTTGNGVAASLAYFVRSVAGNNITIAATRNGTAITATGTGNLTLQTYGYANIEVTAGDSSSQVRASRFLQVDTEGVTTLAFYAENATLCTTAFAELPQTALIDLCLRNCQPFRIDCGAAAKTDFDPNSSSVEFYGQRQSTLQYPGRGMWRDNGIGTNVLSVGNGLNANTGGDLQVRSGGYLYPTIGVGQRIFPRDSSLTLQGFQGAGTVVFNGGAGVTFTLPTIVTDTAPANSHIGLFFDIVNVSANGLTVATDGTQLFNTVAAKTSLTVATQTGLRVLACKTNSGTLFWTARAYALA